MDFTISNYIIYYNIISQVYCLYFIQAASNNNLLAIYDGSSWYLSDRYTISAIRFCAIIFAQLSHGNKVQYIVEPDTSNTTVFNIAFCSA